MAIEVARELNAEIISADSRQFYRKMSIGTAKPSASELKQVKHHFIDTLNPEEDYNIGRFEIDALQKIEELHQKNDDVIMAGGSGLYIKAVCEGLDELPASDPDFRKQLELQLLEKGVDFLAEQLKVKDPVYYEEVDRKNPHRLIRALEVIESTGQPFSSFRKNNITERPFQIIKIAILVDRDTLYDNINRRVDKMFADGLVEEVRTLLPYRFNNALQTVGYAEIFEYFDGKISLDVAKEMIKQNTRHYAKRQMTWFRKEQGIHWVENAAEALEIISR